MNSRSVVEQNNLSTFNDLGVLHLFLLYVTTLCDHYDGWKYIRNKERIFVCLVENNSYFFCHV